MKRTLDAVLAALGYFTILPAGTRSAPTPDALAALPYVGALIGALAGALAWAVSFVAPPALVVATAFAASIVLTGAIHLDGFMDTCDALFASVTLERRLEILKDPRHGTFAVAGFAVLAVVWLAALSTIPPALLPAELALAAALGRYAAILNSLGRTSVPTEASTATLVSEPPIFAIGITGVLLGAVAWCFGTVVIALVPVFGGLGLVLGRGLKGRFGGVLRGDTYGFAIALAEVGALVALSTILGAADRV